jgi:hypothetical protein
MAGLINETLTATKTSALTHKLCHSRTIVGHLVPSYRGQHKIDPRSWAVRTENQKTVRTILVVSNARLRLVDKQIVLLKNALRLTLRPTSV